MKRTLAIILVLAMCLSLLPVAALADFSDVGALIPEFRESIAWAVDKGITNGYEGNEFRPQNPCTRGQVVTFLWRAAGQPEPTGDNPFVDVENSGGCKPYYKAIVWAAEKKITTGFDATHFRPSNTVTRAQFVTFLWRFEGEPAAAGSVTAFTDADQIAVPYRTAVAWAAEKGVTAGYNDGTFRPNAVCTRAHVVTFICRDMKNAATYTVLFDSCGGSEVAQQTVKSGDCVAEPSAPTRDGHVFTGWYTDRDAGEKYDFSARVTGDLTLYAHWTDVSKKIMTIGEEQKIAEGKYKLSGGTYDEVIIPASVGNGDVTLENVTITGKLTVNGGGSDSIHLDGCSVDTIEVNKDLSAADAQVPRIDLTDTPVGTIEARQPVIIEADTDSAIEQVEALGDVTVKGADTMIETITVPEESSAKPVIDVQAGSVGTVQADRPAEVTSSTGSGTVNNVTANADVNVNSGAVTTVTVTTEVTVTVEGSGQITVTVTQEVSVDIVASAGSTVEVSTTVDVGVDVTLNEEPLAHVHKWDLHSEQPATCTAAGSVSYSCSGSGTCDLGGSKTVESAPALGHDWEAVFTTDTPASCTAAGSKSHHCTRCDAKTDETVIPVLGHDYGEASYTWTQADDGYFCTAECVCTRDNTHKKSEAVKASYAVTKAADCENAGIGTYTASFTDAAFAKQTKTVELPALGHDYTVAQHDENNHWMKCSRCDSTDGVTAHSFAAHSCDAAAPCLGCDYIKPAGQHSYGAYSQTKAPSCVETGSEHAFCVNCSHEDVRELPALGHDWSAQFTTDTPATCTAEGSKSHHCTRCDAKTDVTVIPALGHDYGEASYTWTKTEDGYSCTAECVCARDAAHKLTETVEAGYAVTKAADCENSGVGTYTASFANAAFAQQSKSVTLPALGHDWAEVWCCDSQQHWHECRREGCSALSPKEDHVPGAAATLETPQTCTVCGYELAPATGRTVTSLVELAMALEDNAVETVTVGAELTLPDGMAIPEGKTLLVPEGIRVSLTGVLNVYGTLTNYGSLYGYDMIDVFGGTMNNIGRLEGRYVENDHGGMDCVGLLAIEDGGLFNNFCGEKTIGTVIGDINIVDYYRADGSFVPASFRLSEADPLVGSELFEICAACFGTAALVTAIDANAQKNYSYIVSSGDKAGDNLVELGGVTVASGATLVLKAEVFDGTSVYRNSYQIAEGKTLTMEAWSGLVCVGQGSLNIKGELIDLGAFFGFGDFTVTGLSIVGNAGELIAALENGGDVYLMPFEDAQGEGEDRAIIINDRISIENDTRLIHYGADAIYFAGGLYIAPGVTLTLTDGVTLVLASDSTVAGTLEIGSFCTVLVRTPDEAEEGEVTELTVTEAGLIVIGGEDCWGAVLCSAEGDNAGILVNNGTVDCYGDLWFEDGYISGDGAIIWRYIAEVGSRDEFFAAMEKSYVRAIVFVDDVILHAGDCFKGQGMSYEIPENVTVTLACTDENSPPCCLEQGADLRVFGKLVVEHSFCVYSGIWTPEDEPREEHIIHEDRIFYIRNYTDFGWYIREAVGDRLPPITQEDIYGFGAITEDNWPFYDDEWACLNMAFLAKYGGVTVWQDAYDENRIFWPSWEPISYGAAMDILSNVWKAINGEDAELPESIGISWLSDEDHLHDVLCTELVNAFVNALPRIEDERSGITLIRDNVNEGEENLTNDGMTLMGRIFTRPLTIDCETLYLNGDDYGGTLNFVNCEFTQGVTVRLSEDVNYTVNFGNTCTGDVTVVLPEGKTTEECMFGRTHIEFYGVNGMSFDTLSGGAYGNFNDWGHEETVSFVLNGLTITDEGEGAFGVDARYDENGRDEFDQPIYIPTVDVRVFAQVNSVKVSGEDFSGKLRLDGNADVSELCLGDGGFIEIGDVPGMEITLGSNDVLVPGYCGGEYHFTGTGRVIVRNQNMNAQITVNGLYLGTPHIFGPNGDGIFFPLTSTEGVSFKVEQGRWNGEQECVPDDAWEELRFAVDQQADKLHLVGVEGQPWIDDPYQVRVTVTFGEIEAVYETLMWKPVCVGEFVELINGAMRTELSCTDFAANDWDYLSYGIAKQIICAAWTAYTDEELDLRAIIDDENYWKQLEDWESSEDEFKDDWSPDRWTWDWYYAFNIIDRIKNTLGIKDELCGDVTLHLYRDPENEFENIVLNDGEFSFDGNNIRNYRFTGTVTVVCDSNPREYDDWGGCIFFEDCEFANGILAVDKYYVNHALHFRRCSGTELTLVDGENALAPLTLDGSDINVDVRYDEFMWVEDQPVYIPTIQLRDDSEELCGFAVSTNGDAFTGKLRVSGNADVSGMRFAGDGWLEHSGEGEFSDIALGSNEITLYGYCRGSFSFTGDGRVIVRDQNRNAQVTANGLYLGTPHIFGAGGYGIYFPLASTDGIDFKVERGFWDEENGCEGWEELPFSIEQFADKLHLVAVEGQPWIDDPNNVRVTLTFGGIEVVYERIMWKPVCVGEFVELINDAMDTSYGVADFAANDWDYLSYGVAKQIIRTAWIACTGNEPDLRAIIDDENYWKQLADWESSEDEFKDDWSPDLWTWDWYITSGVIGRLTELLSQT